MAIKGELNINRRLILFCLFFIFISACKDKESKINDIAAECTSGDKEACEELAEIAKNDESYRVRLTAVEKLNDQIALADIVKNAEDFDICEVAVEKLTDQVLLADVAKNGMYADVRISAVKKLTDQKLLVDILTKAVDSDVRVVAVERLTDYIVLAKIALEDLSLGDTAIKRLAVQASLTQATVNDKDESVRLILKFITAFDSVPAEHRGRLMIAVLPAIRVLSSPAVVSAIGDLVSIETEWHSMSQGYLGSLIGNMHGEKFTCSIQVQRLTERLSHTWSTSFPEVTTSLVFKDAEVKAADILKELFEKLTDQSVLSYIAKNDKDPSIRLAAVENPNLTDQTSLADIAKNDEKWKVRKAAVEKLTDQALLADIAKNDKNEDVRKAAVVKLTDQSMLADIARNAKNAGVRQAAVVKLTDQSVLADIARNAQYSDVREVVVEKLTDQTLITDIARNDKNGDVRVAAAEKLIDQTVAQSVFADIARNSQYSEVRMVVVEKLTDQALLADIAKNDKNSWVREAAERRLKVLWKK